MRKSRLINTIFVIGFIMLLFCIVMMLINGDKVSFEKNNYNITVNILLCVLFFAFCILTVQIFIKNRRYEYLKTENKWNEYKLETIKNGFNDGFFEYDFENKKFIYNKNFKKTFVQNDDFNMEAFKTFIHEDDLLRCNYLADENFFVEEKYISEIRIKDKNTGIFKWYNCSILVRYNGESKPVHLVCVLQNIDKLMSKKEALEIEARHDSLTGLLNRRYTEYEIIKNLGEKTENLSAFIVVDINEFKQINDVYTHKLGDEALKHVAAVLTKVFRRSDVIGRIGGDEFVVFMISVPHRDIIRKSLDRVKEEMANTGGKLPFNITCSAGISIFPNDGETYDSLFFKADLALYEAKETKTGKHFIYGSDEYIESKIKRFSENNSPVYVLDLITKEILYTNKALDEWAAEQGTPESEFCYQRIMNRTHPCENCPAEAWANSGKMMYSCQFTISGKHEVGVTVAEITWKDTENAVIVSINQ